MNYSLGRFVHSFGAMNFHYVDLYICLFTLKLLAIILFGITSNYTV